VRALPAAGAVLTHYGPRLDDRVDTGRLGGGGAVGADASVPLLGPGARPDALAEGGSFLLTVASGAGLTVILATVIGFPISTTHALDGGTAPRAARDPRGSRRWRRYRIAADPLGTRGNRGVRKPFPPSIPTVAGEASRTIL